MGSKTGGGPPPVSAMPRTQGMLSHFLPDLGVSSFRRHRLGTQDKAPETPSGCGSLRTPKSQKPLRPPQPHRLAAGGSPTSHRNQPHPWVPHPGPLLKRAQGTRVSEPTYQEHVLGFIIPGQQDKLSQQVSFQTGASEKAGGGNSIYTMFQMMRLVSRHSARSDQI